MSLETISRVRNRVYQRHFDHDEARRLHAEGGWTWNGLARHFGVTSAAVKRVCDPATNARMHARTTEFLRNSRVPCRGGCGRLVWPATRDRSGLCRTCFAARQVAADLRDGELRCTRCRKWKPDEEFPTSHKVKSRRGHDPWCRECATIARREHRERNPELQKAADRRMNAKRAKERCMRYVVLQPTDAGTYIEVARLDAGSPAHAVEQAATSEGNYIAIQESRFAPMTVAPVQAFRVVTNGGDPTK